MGELYSGLDETVKTSKKSRVFVVFCLLSYTLPMLKQQAIQLAGSQAKLAKLLGISRGAVWLWKTIPQARIWQLKLIRPEWFEVIQ